jgi:hypothetical protein
MIDPPNSFDTLATWEQHLKDVQALSVSTENKRELIESAEGWIPAATKPKICREAAARDRLDRL